MEDAKDLIPPALGDVRVIPADGITSYQPDMVVLGDAIGARIGSLVMIFRPASDGTEEKDQ